MAHPVTALFDGVVAKYQADTGSGGLNDSSNDGAARIKHMISEEARLTNPSDPYVRVVIRDVDDDAIVLEQSELVLEFVIYTKDTKAPTEREAVAERIKALYEGTALTLTGFTLDHIHRLGGNRIRPFDIWRRWSERFIVHFTES